MILTMLHGRISHLEAKKRGGDPLESSLKMFPNRISCLEAEEGGGVPLDDPPVLHEMMSYPEAKERGGDPLDEPHNASREDILSGGQGERRRSS